MLVAKLAKKKLELLTACEEDLSHNWLPVSQKNATMRKTPSLDTTTKNVQRQEMIFNSQNIQDTNNE